MILGQNIKDLFKYRKKNMKRKKNSLKLGEILNRTFFTIKKKNKDFYYKFHSEKDFSFFYYEFPCEMDGNKNIKIKITF
jgi:hypothetical protein